MKNRLMILLAFVMALSCVQYSSAFATEEPETVELQIISTSDVHGKFLPFDYALNAPDDSGSLSQASTVIQSLRNENTMEWSCSYFNTFHDGDLTISFNPDIRGYNYDMFSGVKYDVDKQWRIPFASCPFLRALLKCGGGKEGNH